MGFQNKKHSLYFILITYFILIFISQTFLIFNYMDVPRLRDRRDYIFGIDDYKEYNNVVHKKFDWSISFNDNKISNMEHIIIYICMLWGFLRLIDLMRFLEKYKNDETIFNN